MKKTSKIAIFLTLLILLAILLINIAGVIIHFLYPLKYEDDIFRHSEENSLNPYFVMAVIKAESNFDPKAHSGIARGLMQITDSTAEWIADKMNIEFEPNDIENPETNIKMGCYYLKYLSELYHDDTLILASYNAGMGNVSKWLNDDTLSKDSRTLEHIPYSETRGYVEKVIRYERIYKKIYGNKTSQKA